MNWLRLRRKRGTLATVLDWLSHQTTIDYDNNSNISVITYPNSTTATYGVDYADRLMSINDAKTGSTFASFTYTRFNANQLQTLTPTGVTRSNETYGYSNLDQVASVNSNAYQYDHADNLTGIISSNGNTLKAQAVSGSRIQIRSCCPRVILVNDSA